MEKKEFWNLNFSVMTTFMRTEHLQKASRVYYILCAHRVVITLRLLGSKIKHTSDPYNGRWELDGK